MKQPASYYIHQIPDYVESAILALSRHDRYNLIDDLVESIRDRRWWTGKVVLSKEVFVWLDGQKTDTFKALLRWVVNELI